MKKILILGATGMAGHTITLYFSSKGFDVTALSQIPISFFKGKNVVMDVFNTEELSILIKSENYDAIINCVGILNETAEKNKDKAVFLNSYLPHFLVNITKT